MSLQAKIQAHKRFWAGDGPCLLLIPTGRFEQYDVSNYLWRHEHPRAMWETEVQAARRVLEWPTDGIPTIRPNLGVVFVPSMAGQTYHVQDGQMPWAGEPMDRESIDAIAGLDVSHSRLMRLAADFYRTHQARGNPGIAAYHPDTQGVFDIAHMLVGRDIFTMLYDEPEWVHHVLSNCLDLYIRASVHVKELLAEEPHGMIHGHGTPQGLFFPTAGVRTAEDSATLLSPAMIEHFVIPYLERALEPFGGGFVHYCGKHEWFFERLCQCPLVRAIDLGNSELYDHRWLFQTCAQHGVVLYSRISAEPGEDWRAYVSRMACYVKDTGARCALRPTSFPDSREECAEMLDIWHESTG